MAKQDKDIFIKRFGEVMGAATQKQFAEKLHTTQTTISKILNGKSDPSLEILKTIVEEYGVSLDWLLGLCEEKYIHNVSVHKLTYPYVLSVFYELLQGGNISVKITSNENSDVPDTWEDRLYGHEQNCALILKDVVLKELMLKLNSDIRISKKAAESWKDSVSDDFKELLDWNDEKLVQLLRSINMNHSHLCSPCINKPQKISFLLQPYPRLRYLLWKNCLKMRQK